MRLDSGHDTVILAILVSRVEALCTASMLEANGVAVQIDGFYHASVEVNSWVLGGHRLRIAQADYQVASDLLREVGSADNWSFSYGLRRAVLRLVAFWSVFFLIPMLIISFRDSRDPVSLIILPLTVYGLNVNPQGSGDYYLAPVTSS